MSVSQINSKMTEAVAAYEAGDLATAITKLNSARMLLAALPNTAGDNASLQWDRAAMDRMAAELQRQRNAAGGIRRSKVTYTAVENDEEE